MNEEIEKLKKENRTYKAIAITLCVLCGMLILFNVIIFCGLDLSFDSWRQSSSSVSTAAGHGSTAIVKPGGIPATTAEKDKSGISAVTSDEVGAITETEPHLSLNDLYEEYMALRAEYLKGMADLYDSFVDSHDLTSDLLTAAEDLNAKYAAMVQIYETVLYGNYDHSSARFQSMKKDIVDHQLGRFLYILHTEDVFYPEGSTCRFTDGQWSDGSYTVRYANERFEFGTDYNPPGIAFSNLEEVREKAYQILDRAKPSAIMYGEKEGELYIFFLSQ